MPRYQQVSCRVHLGGEQFTIVHRTRFNPLSLPALIVIEKLHGAENITHVEDAGLTDDIPAAEMWQRLVTTYSKSIVEGCFPGARPRLPVRDSSIPMTTKDEKEPVAPREPEVSLDEETIEFDEVEPNTRGDGDGDGDEDAKREAYPSPVLGDPAPVSSLTAPIQRARPPSGGRRPITGRATQEFEGASEGVTKHPFAEGPSAERDNPF